MKQKRKGGRPPLGEEGKTVRINVRLPQETADLLDEARKKLGKKKEAAVVREVIEKGLEVMGIVAKPKPKSYANPMR